MLWRSHRIRTPRYSTRRSRSTCTTRLKLRFRYHISLDAAASVRLLSARNPDPRAVLLSRLTRALAHRMRLGEHGETLAFSKERRHRPSRNAAETSGQWIFASRASKNHPSKKPELHLHFHYRGATSVHAPEMGAVCRARERWYPHLGDSAEFLRYDSSFAGRETSFGGHRRNRRTQKRRASAPATGETDRPWSVPQGFNVSARGMALGPPSLPDPVIDHIRQSQLREEMPGTRLAQEGDAISDLFRTFRSCHRHRRTPLRPTPPGPSPAERAKQTWQRDRFLVHYI